MEIIALGLLPTISFHLVVDGGDIYVYIYHAQIIVPLPW